MEKYKSVYHTIVSPLNMFVAGVMSGMLVAMGALSNYRTYESIRDVERGYVVPSKLEIEVRDLDKNGNKETYLEYDGISYALRVDESGKPYVQDYEINPAEIVLKNLRVEK